MNKKEIKREEMNKQELRILRIIEKHTGTVNSFIDSSGKCLIFQCAKEIAKYNKRAEREAYKRGQRKMFTRKERELIDDLLVFDRYYTTEIKGRKGDAILKESILKKLSKLNK